MDSESVITRDICRGLRNCGAVVIAVQGGMKTTVGTPDRFIAHIAFSGWVEFKRFGGSLTQPQWIMHQQLLACKFPAIICWYDYPRDCIVLQCGEDCTFDTKDVVSLSALRSRDSGAALELLISMQKTFTRTIK